MLFGYNDLRMLSKLTNFENLFKIHNQTQFDTIFWTWWHKIETYQSSQISETSLPQLTSEWTPMHLGRLEQLFNICRYDWKSPLTKTNAKVWSWKNELEYKNGASASRLQAIIIIPTSKAANFWGNNTRDVTVSFTEICHSHIYL